jgi:hypothetical protein
LLFDAWREEATGKKGEEAMEILEAHDVDGVAASSGGVGGG